MPLGRDDGKDARPAAGVDHDAAVEAMRLASHKLPVATRVVVREGAKEA